MKTPLITALTLSLFLSLTLSAQAETGKGEFPDLDALTSTSGKGAEEHARPAKALGQPAETENIKAANLQKKDGKTKEEIYKALDRMKAKGRKMNKPAN